MDPFFTTFRLRSELLIIPSLKLTAKRLWKWMVEIRLFPFGSRPIFRRYVSFRECIPSGKGWSWSLPLKKKNEIEEDISSRLPFIYQLQEELFFESDADDSRIFQQQVISREGPRHVQHQSLCFEKCIMIWLSQVIGVAKCCRWFLLLLSSKCL